MPKCVKEGHGDEFGLHVMYIKSAVTLAPLNPRPRFESRPMCLYRVSADLKK